MILQVICYWVIQSRETNWSANRIEKEILNEAESFFDKGLINQLRRNRTTVLKIGQKIGELADALIKKRLGL